MWNFFFKYINYCSLLLKLNLSLTFKSTSRNNKPILYVNQTVSLWIRLNIVAHLPRQVLPDFIQMFRPVSVFRLLDTFQNRRILRPIWQGPIHQLVRWREILINVLSNLRSSRFIISCVHQPVETDRAETEAIDQLIDHVTVKQPNYWPRIGEAIREETEIGQPDNCERV